MMHNVSFITVFTLSGLNEIMDLRLTLFFLSLLCYCVILMVNVCLIVTIIMDENLHEPMYILLCSFCINGLYGATGFYPKFLWDLLSPLHVISYAGCLLQAFVMHSFACSDLSILAVMAYDRYLAICRPLEYHAVMTKQRLSQLVCWSWILPFCIVGTNLFLTSSLRLCSSNIERLFCINRVIVKLACPSINTNIYNIVTYLTISFYVSHGLVITWSYMYLIRTCVRSVEESGKFMQTCLPHLISLFIFLVCILFDVICTKFGSKYLPQMLQNVISIEFLLIPPVMNPLIYGYKLTKIRNRILSFVTAKRN
ncbi:olfactory receptor 51E1-like [Lampris incognitus]|uniref:olfactory receptor 51E1-like n=1 Tax=Lampris incognitus TaxID=2546036 RepID=UPI0024B4AEB7|nr:olfactory receptor 51E1-like [Lampris incognitus]